MAEPIRGDSVSRRTVLKGMAGAAGLVSIPAIIAACSTPASSSRRRRGVVAASAAPPHRSAVEPRRQRRRSARSPSARTSPTRRRRASRPSSTRSPQRPASPSRSTPSTTAPSRTRSANYLQAQAGRRRITWFSGFRMRFFATQGLSDPDRRRLDQGRAATTPTRFEESLRPATTASNTSIPFDYYPWAVFYRKSLFADKSYTIPDHAGRVQGARHQDEDRRPDPDGLGDKDGWPAMGTFDIINLRQNGYDFHVGLMAGKEKWTDPKVKQVFKVWKDLLPFYQEGYAGRTWQDAAAGLVKKKAGMTCSAMFVSQQFAAAGAGRPRRPRLLPIPELGTQYDAEKALDAPIDGFMLAAKSPTLAADQDAAKAFLEFSARARPRSSSAKATSRDVADRQGHRHQRLHAAPEEGRRGRSATPSGSPSSSTATPAPTSPANRHAGVPARLPHEPGSGPRRLPEEDPGLLGLARHGG